MSFIPYNTNLCNDETTISIFNFPIQEPVTTITNIFITVVCWIIFFKSKNEVEKNHITTLFRYFFFVMGAATLLGGILGHALCYRVGMVWKLPGWISSMVAVMLAERAVIMHARQLMKPSIGKILAVINIIEVIIMITITTISLNFFFVELHAFYGLLIVVGTFELFYFMRTKDKASKNILLSVCVSAIAAVVHIGKLSIDKWFNNVDASHCIMAVSAIIMYNGVKKIKLLSLQTPV